MATQLDNKSTKIVSLTATGTTITATTFCRRIRVGENFTSAVGPTTDLGQTAPVGAGEIIIPKGVPCVFTAGGGPNGGFTPGTIVGKVRVLNVAGPVEGQQIEDQVI